LGGGAGGAWVGGIRVSLIQRFFSQCDL